MLTLYAITLAVGGTLILASIVMGGEDFDADGDFDTDGDIDVGGALAWLPLASLRFWTFFLGFFGLTGVAMIWSGALKTEPIIGVISGVTGYFAGIAAVKVFRGLRDNQTDSSVRLTDYAGATGTVSVGIAPDKTGKVTTRLRGRIVELMAVSEEGTIASGEKVLIVEVNEDGTAVVTKMEE